MTNSKFWCGNLDAENQRVRFAKGIFASEKPRCGTLFRKTKSFVLSAACLLVVLSSTAKAEPVDGFYYGIYWAAGGLFDETSKQWYDNCQPTDGGIGYFMTSSCIDLFFWQPLTVRGFDFGDVVLSSDNKPTLQSKGLTMSGDAFIEGTGGANCGTFAILDAGYINGTGSNTLSKRGTGTLLVKTAVTNFAAIVAQGGNLRSRKTGEQLYAKGPTSFVARGGTFLWEPDIAAGVAGAATMGATSFGSGSSSIRWSKGSGASATLTLASLAREDDGGTLLVDPANGLSALGETEKLMVAEAPPTVNGIMDPGIVVRDATVESCPLSFAKYDAEKGVVACPASSMKSLDAAGAADVAQVASATTLSASKQVAALAVQNTSALTIADGVTLKVGDDNAAHPAGVIFNAQVKSPSDTAMSFSGKGTLDFGASPGVIWMSSPTQSGTWGGNRRLSIATKITGSNGVTFAGRHRGNPVEAKSFGFFYLNNGSCLWSGPTRVSGAVLWLASSNCLPAGDIYVVDGMGYGSQLRSDQAFTYGQNFHLSGYGPIGELGLMRFPSGTSKFNGKVTLLGSAVFGGSSTSTADFAKGIAGPGDLIATTAMNFVFRGTNTFNSFVAKSGPTVLNIASNGTLCAGRMWYKAGTGHWLKFARRAPETLVVTNEFRQESGTTLGVQATAANVAFTKSVSLSTLAMDNFAAVAVGGIARVENVSATGSHDERFGVERITAATDDAVLDVGSATDGVLALPLDDGDGTLALTKSGTGVLELPCASRTYSGATTVAEGTLRLNGNPLESKSLVYWLDASRPQDFTKDATTGAITTWKSRGGSSGISFSVSSGAPVWGQGEKVNGLDVVSTGIEGSADRLVGSATVTQATVFVVCRTRTASKYSGLFGKTASDVGLRMSDNIAANPRWETMSGGWTYNTTGSLRRDGVKESRIDAGNVHVFALIHDRTGWPSSESWGSATVGADFKPALGGYSNYDQYCYQGDYCEVIAFDRVLGESELRSVENYLSEKWLAKTIWDDTAAPAALPSATALTVATGATFDLAGVSATVASLAGSGLITNSSATAATLTVTGTDAFAGTVRGPVTIVAGTGSEKGASYGDGTRLNVAGGTLTTGTRLLTPPTDGLAYWCDAGLPETVLTNENGGVTGWVSRVTSSAKALVNTGTIPGDTTDAKTKTCPTYGVTTIAALGGNPGIVFSSSERQALWADGKSSVRSVFVVASLSGTQPNYNGLWGVAGLDSGFRFSSSSTSLEGGGLYARPTDPKDWVHVDGLTVGNASFNYGNGTVRVLSVRLESAHHTAKYMSQIGLGATASRTTVLGSYTGKNSFAGVIGEVIAYDRELSDDEMRAVESYLINKWKKGAWTDGRPPAESETSFAGGSLSVAAGASATVPDGTHVGVLSGGGTLTGDVVADGFDVYVKNDGEVDCLTVDGSVTLGASAALIVHDKENLPRRVKRTFLEAVSLMGAFGSTNLGGQYGYDQSATSAWIYRGKGLVITIR